MSEKSYFYTGGRGCNEDFLASAAVNGNIGEEVHKVRLLYLAARICSSAILRWPCGLSGRPCIEGCR